MSRLLGPPKSLVNFHQIYTAAPTPLTAKAEPMNRIVSPTVRPCGNFSSHTEQGLVLAASARMSPLGVASDGEGDVIVSGCGCSSSTMAWLFPGKETSYILAQRAGTCK